MTAGSLLLAPTGGRAQSRKEVFIGGTLDRFPNLKVCAGQVVYGTDIPAAWPDTLDLIVESPSLSDAEKEAIVGGNLIEMLKL